MTDEAKRCVEALRWSHLHDGCRDKAYICPVVHGCVRSDRILCDPAVAADLIESLCAELEQVKRERDAAVEELKEYLTCHGCTNDSFCKKDYPVCDGCELVKCPCYSCTGLSNWQWCGVRKEET